MLILLLTNGSAVGFHQLVEGLSIFGDEVVVSHEAPSLAGVKAVQPDWIISDRNEHLISSEIIDFMQKRVLNSHASLLPRHRGWQPIFFSCWNQDNVGISIHLVDSGLDTGPIAHQAQLRVQATDTLRSLYARARFAILQGFVELMPYLRANNLQGRTQPLDGGSFHSKSEFLKLYPKLANGWDSEVQEIHAIRQAE